MSNALSLSIVLLLVLSAQALLIVFSVYQFLKHDNHQRIAMSDILYLLASIGFFGLMLVFVWACEKV